MEGRNQCASIRRRIERCARVHSRNQRHLNLLTPPQVRLLHGTRRQTKIKQQALRDNIAYFRKKILEQAGTNWLGGSMDSGALS